MISHLLAQKCPKKDISKKGRPAINGNFECVDIVVYYKPSDCISLYISHVHLLYTSN